MSDRELDSFDVPPPKPSQQIQVELSAGDRDTLTDALKTAFDQWDEYGAQHGYSAIDDTFWVDGYSFTALESIVASRVRAAQAQAWDEGATHADRSWQHSEYNNSDDPTDPNFWETDTSANPYRSEAGEKLPRTED